MANDKKFVVKNGLTTQNVSFVDNTQSTNNTITVTMLNSDTLSFSGDSGQLFSITDSMSGTIFAVNDISGVPSIEVDDDGTIRFAETFGNVLIGTATDNGTDKLQVNGTVSANNVTITGALSANGSIGTTGQTLRSDGTKTYWSTEVGYTGSRGFTGSKGDIGYTGSKGDIGFTGSVGFVGSRGATGFTGSQGVQGITGFTGSKGDKGDIGFTGSQGTVGFTGSKGDVGFAGSTGFTGSKGDTGFTGSAGPSTQINAADVSDNDTVYPVFVTDAGSNQTAEVSTTKLYFNPFSGELSATNFNSTSDIRFKENIEKIENALEKVRSISGYTFTFSDSGLRSAGVIAQEIEKVLPEAVSGTEEKKTVAYDTIIGLLIEAIKELDAKIK